MPLLCANTLVTVCKIRANLMLILSLQGCEFASVRLTPWVQIQGSAPYCPLTFANRREVLESASLTMWCVCVCVCVCVCAGLTFHIHSPTHVPSQPGPPPFLLILDQMGVGVWRECRVVVHVIGYVVIAVNHSPCAISISTFLRWKYSYCFSWGQVCILVVATELQSAVLIDSCRSSVENTSIFISRSYIHNMYHTAP